MVMLRRSGAETRWKANARSKVRLHHIVMLIAFIILAWNFHQHYEGSSWSGTAGGFPDNTGVRKAVTTNNPDTINGITHKNNFIYKSHKDTKLEPTNCSELLHKYRTGQIKQTNQASDSYPIDKSYVARSNTQYSFHASLHAEKIDSIRFSIFNSGNYYEDIMTNVIADLFSKANRNEPAVMLDVGANVGWFSLLAASHGAEVFAFEPNAINMVRFCESQLLNGWSLAQNSERNNRIHSYLKGVGSQHGQSLNMYTPDPSNPGSHTFNQELAKGHFDKRKAGGELQKLDGELPIVTLDALAEDQGWLSVNNNVRILLMKMDIEGMEHVALNGSKKLLKANIIDNILMELNADSPRADELSVVSTLLECGYELYKIGDHRGPRDLFQLKSSDAGLVFAEIMKSSYAKNNMNAWFKVKTS